MRTDKSSDIQTLIVAGVLLSSSVLIAAQTTSTIRVFDGRPLAAIIKELGDRFGRAITYEDPHRLFASDIADVTDKYKDKATRQVLVPRGGDLAFTFTPSDMATMVPSESSRVWWLNTTRLARMASSK